DTRQKKGATFFLLQSSGVAAVSTEGFRPCSRKRTCVYYTISTCAAAWPNHVPACAEGARLAFAASDVLFSRCVSGWRIHPTLVAVCLRADRPMDKPRAIQLWIARRSHPHENGVRRARVLFATSISALRDVGVWGARGGLQRLPR